MMPNISPHESKVLTALAASYSEDFGYICFATIARRTRLKRSIIRIACRSLSRKDLARYARGLWSEDGNPRGSGYAATFAGYELADKQAIDRIQLREWD